MMHSSPDNNRFLAALARFERSLETPIVPGEMAAWLRKAREALREAGERFRDEEDAAHEQLRQDILREDIALAPRVEELKEKHEDVRDRWIKIRMELEQLCEEAERAEPHEAKLDDEIERFKEKALSFVIAARSHETAITTWYMEALNRDRGIAD